MTFSYRQHQYIRIIDPGGLQDWRSDSRYSWYTIHRCTTSSIPYLSSFAPPPFFLSFSNRSSPPISQSRRLASTSGSLFFSPKAQHQRFIPSGSHSLTSPPSLPEIRVTKTSWLRGDTVCEKHVQLGRMERLKVQVERDKTQRRISSLLFSI